MDWFSGLWFDTLDSLKHVVFTKQMDRHLLKTVGNDLVVPGKTLGRLVLYGSLGFATVGVK